MIKNKKNSPTRNTKKTPRKPRNTKNIKNPKDNLLLIELSLIGAFFVFVFSNLSLYGANLGVLGTVTRDVLIGIFSFSAYIVPFYFMFIIIISNFRKFKTRRVFLNLGIISLMLGEMLLSSVISIALNIYEKPKTISFELLYNKAIDNRGLGVVPAFLYDALEKVIGTLGIVLLALSFILIFAIIIFKISPRKALLNVPKAALAAKDAAAKGSKKVGGIIKENLEKSNEIHEQINERNEIANPERPRKRRARHLVDFFFYKSNDDKDSIKVMNSAHRLKELNQKINKKEENLGNQSSAEISKEQSLYSLEDKIAKDNTLNSKSISDDIYLNNQAQDLSENYNIDNIQNNNTQKDFNLRDDSLLAKDKEKTQNVKLEIQEQKNGEGLLLNQNSLIPSTEEVRVKKPYKLPPINLLEKKENQKHEQDKKDIFDNAKKLEETFKNFKIDAKVLKAKIGPMITRYEVEPSPGVKISRIAALSDDIALSLAAVNIRILAPIPGKSVVGVEVPNKNRSVVKIREVIESNIYKSEKSLLKFVLGKNISGQDVIGDLAKMPHLLIAGATGSGKSVCVNSIITSILYNAKPEEVKFLMIDPKVVELNIYNGIAHLILPVVTDPNKASTALNWAVEEMNSRYNIFAENMVKDVNSYNKKIEETDEDLEFMPRIVIIIDELADLMMTCQKQVEDSIARIAQKARAAGIHLIVATQRPSVDVITGLIKANIPSRIAFAVSSQVDSRTILDEQGADKLLGRGDMLFLNSGMSKPVRVQGTLVTDEEVKKLVDYVIDEYGENIHSDDSMLDDYVNQSLKAAQMDELDELFTDALEFVRNEKKASTSMIQRRFKIGYNRAARIIDDMEKNGYISKQNGSKPRDILNYTN